MKKFLMTIAVFIFSSAALAQQLPRLIYSGPSSLQRTISLRNLPAQTVIRIPMQAIVEAKTNEIMLAEPGSYFNCSLKFAASDRSRSIGEVRINVETVQTRYNGIRDVFKFFGEYYVDGRKQSEMILACESLGFAYIEHLSGILRPFEGSVVLPEAVPF